VEPRLPVHWTDEAKAQLDDIYQYVARRSPAYARRVVDRLTRRSERIADFPLVGRAVPEVELPQLREVVEGPYRLVYHLRPDRIDVVAVFHGARQSPWAE
jgi:addiction module RelE/StbE family toxin